MIQKLIKLLDSMDSNVGEIAIAEVTASESMDLVSEARKVVAHILTR